MKRLANILWIYLIGIWMAIINVIIGVVLCATLIFIPIGFQYLKLANVFALPFGVKFVTNFKKHAVANILYDIFTGFINAIILMVLAGICCLSIIGIPFGVKCYKLCIVSLAPVGLDIE